MQKVFKKVVEILDGTPSVYGERQRGQSVLEMTFITPLLIILIFGIVEIGWLANNYLSLQEVAKVGARRGTVLPSNLGPLAWENDEALSDASLLPHQYTDGQTVHPDGNVLIGTPDFDRANWDSALIRYECNDLVLRTDANGNEFYPVYRGFYNEILCVMQDSMDPITFNQENGVDDIVISVFAVQTLLNDPAGDYDFENGYSPQVDVDEYAPGWIPIVVGRYPTNANECNLEQDDTPTDFQDNDVEQFERDPFDYINDGALTYGDDGLPIELYREGVLPDGSPFYLTAGQDSARELQRGFAWLGNHMVETMTVIDSSGNEVEYEVFCFGSSWSIYDIQEQISVPGFAFTAADDDTLVGNDDTGIYLPNQGLVLVEIYWQHRLLLNLPVFSPVMQALGDDRTTIYVWSVFPVPTVEPNIVYP